jgi:hypothetical protein
MSTIRLHDTVQFFPFDPIRKEIHLTNAPLEGTVVEDLRRHYRVWLACRASCLVLKTNPSLAKCPTPS